MEDYTKYLFRETTKSSNSDKKLNKFIQIQTNSIILADDNHLINTCNKKIILEILNDLQIYDIEVICVNDGIDVVKLYLNYENTDIIKFILTDENMDYMNGSEAVKIIRKIESMKNLKRVNIISLSCHEDVNMRNLIIGAGVDYILTKPLSKQILKSLLKKNKLLF